MCVLASRCKRRCEGSCRDKEYTRARKAGVVDVVFVILRLYRHDGCHVLYYHRHGAAYILEMAGLVIA